MLHVFDLDHTLFRVNSSYDFSLYLYRKGKLKLRTLARIALIYFAHKMGFLSLEDCHLSAFDAIFKGELRNKWSSELPGYLEECERRVVSPSVLKRLREAQARGDETALFSSSPDFVVEFIANHFSINVAFSSKYEVDKAGRFDKISSLINGKEKGRELARLARIQGIPLGKVVAYSDSILDLELLEKAGMAVCVSPDKQLKAVAERKGWEVIEHDTIERDPGFGKKKKNSVARQRS